MISRGKTLNIEFGDVYSIFWRRGGLMVSALDSGSIGLNSNVGQRYFIVFFRKILHSHSVSLHPGGRGTSKFNAGGNSVMD